LTFWGIFTASTQVAMTSRLPALLEPYLALPSEASLILVTNVLGASANWLVLRYLYAYLKASKFSGDAGDETIGVVFASFLRDAAFWRDGAGRMVSRSSATEADPLSSNSDKCIQGLDLDGLGRAGRFQFVDGLGGLCTGEAPLETGKTKNRVIRSPRIDHVQAELEAALGDLTSRRKVLIVDQLDALLAVSEDNVTSTSLSSMLLSLREVCTTQSTASNRSEDGFHAI
jgi:elongator complex protein 6